MYGNNYKKALTHDRRVKKLKAKAKRHNKYED